MYLGSEDRNSLRHDHFYRLKLRAVGQSYKKSINCLLHVVFQAKMQTCYSHYLIFQFTSDFYQSEIFLFFFTLKVFHFLIEF